MRQKEKRLKPNRRVTARDVAELVNVSPSTVSRVLSGAKSDMISEETRQRVHEAAQELGYAPNPIAQALRGKKLRLLGLIVREIADPFFASFIAELSIQAREQNYHIVLGYAQSDPQEALEMTNVLDTRHTAGVFILGDLHNDEAALEEMLKDNHAVVAMCRGPSPVMIYTVNSDNFAGIRIMIDHLYELGHRHIGFIDGGWLGDIRERQQAFVDYLHELNLPTPFKWIQGGANSFHGGYQAMQQLLNLSEQPTAVTASDDVMAIGALKAVSDAGFHVPEDISVAGFDDIEMAQYTYPALTTIRQPIEEISRQALQFMLDLIDNQDTQQEKTIIRIPPELIVRQSTGPVPVD